MTLTTPRPPVRESRGDHHKWVVLSILALGQLMVVLDTTIVNVALPAIQASLHFSSTADLQWVVRRVHLDLRWVLAPRRTSR